MNRKKNDKTIHKDNFEDLDDEDLQKMMHDSPWFNPDKLTEEDREDFISNLSARTGRTIYLDDGSDRSSLFRFNECYPNLELPVLYQELDNSYKDGKFEDGTVAHRMKRRSADFKRLSQWSKYKDSLEPFILPIHYQINGKTHKKVFPIKADSPMALQNIIAHSFFDTAYIIPLQILEALENTLEVCLMKAIVYKEIILFCFEWVFAMPFIFYMAFKINLTEDDDESVRDFISNDFNVITFSRSHILEYDETDQKNREEKEKTNTKKKATKKNKKKNNEMEVETSPMMEDEKKLRYFDAGDSTQEGEMIRKVIKTLQLSFISFINAGYIKRD